MTTMNPYGTDNDSSNDRTDELIKRSVTIDTDTILKDGRGNEYSVIIDNSGNIEIYLIEDDHEDGGV